MVCNRPLGDFVNWYFCILHERPWRYSKLPPTIWTEIWNTGVAGVNFRSVVTAVWRRKTLQEIKIELLLRLLHPILRQVSKPTFEWQEVVSLQLLHAGKEKDCRSGWRERSRPTVVPHDLPRARLRGSNRGCICEADLF